MIRTKAEYKRTKEKLRRQEELIRQQHEQLEDGNLSREQAREVLDPMISLRDQLHDEVESFEQAMDGNLPAIRNLENIHRWLIGGRIAKGWTLSDLADALDVSVQQVSRDEKNEYHGVTLNKVQRVLKTLGIEFCAELAEPPEPDEGVQEPIDSTVGIQAMSRLALADATDLENWANRRDAQGLFPELIRRLVYATNRSVTRVRFDSKKGVQAGGWDGIVKARQVSPYVPSGASYWELGTGKSIRDKANRDYRKRTKNPLGATPSEDTFIFVTPRDWPRKDEWEREKEDTGEWNEVRVYDANDLIGWLEHAPAVYAWISNLIGYPVDQLESLSSWWNRWAGATEPHLTPDLVIGGRSDVAEEMQDWLRSPPDSFTLEADSREEALAFFAASIYQLPDKEKDELLSRCLIVQDSKAWNQVSRTDEGLLVPLFESSGEVAEAVRNGQHVFVPGDRKMTSPSAENELPRLRVDAAREALKKMGLEGERAQRRASTARRSLLSLRRMLATDPSLKRPEWARSGQTRPLLPALLAGRWLEGKEGDEKALSKLASTGYKTYSRMVTELANASDPPIRKVGSVWIISSKWDAWRMVAQDLTDADLQRFGEVVMEVLGTPDPALELPQDERWMAGVRGYDSPHSKHLREGIADTLALMAVRGEKESTREAAFRGRAIQIVQDLFGQANGDAKLWASLGDVLPLLAEAVPDVFLKAVEDGLSGEKPLLLDLFADDDSSSMLLGPSSPHTGLLWALENLAWSRDHFGHAVQLLASLTRIDPGGRLANRPGNSLRRIFVFWLPQTTASLEKRLEALDALREREPEVAWTLMESILPKNHDSLSPNHKPYRRTWGWNSRSGVPYAEIMTGIEEVVSRMLEDAAADPERWKDLISNVGTLPEEQQDAVLETLRELDRTSIDVNAERVIYEALQQVISRHRGYPEADWSLPASRVDRLAEVASGFDSVSSAWKSKHLFDHGALRQFEGESWKEKQKALDAVRDEAVKDVLENESLKSIIGLIPYIDRPRDLGRSLGRIGLVSNGIDVELSFLRENFASSDNSLTQLARGYVFGIFERAGRDGAMDTLRKGVDADWPDSIIAAYLLALPPDDQTWEIAEELDSDVERAYWSQFDAAALPDDADRTYAIEQLIKHDRPHAAVDFLGLYADDEEFPSSLIVDTLKQAVRIEPRSGMWPQMFKHHVGDLLSHLEEDEGVDRQTVASLEWAYLPLFHADQGPHSAKVLHAELARDPEFFVEVVSFVYRPDDDDDEDLSEADQTRARLGYKLLNSWTTVPGSREDDSIDEESLFEWIERAREMLAEKGRLGVGDRQIGRILQYGPEPKNDKWPAKPIRNLIEDVASDDIEAGFYMEVHNSRGAHTVSAARERSLAERYRRFADSVSTRWPRTARMLRGIAEDFERNANRYETEAELREDLRR